LFSQVNIFSFLVQIETCTIITNLNHTKNSKIHDCTRYVIESSTNPGVP